MIQKRLISRCYESALIQRWNDHVRPVEFTELDKQAHKMVIAFILAKFEETEKKTQINWIYLIEGSIFEFLHRVILTDIKPPVFHKMMAKKGNELNKWVLTQLDRDLTDTKFKERFNNYFFDDGYARFEKRILKAAHYLATNWEFKIIYNSCPFMYGIEKTKEDIENQIEDHYDLTGVQKISLGKKSFGFVDLCGQLRFQQRWAQTPRIPKTSVLGHMLIVAIMSYLCSIEISACNKRVYNNFFCALFHDLPEVLTRDIVSPIKHSLERLRELIKKYERIQMNEILLPLLPEDWHSEMRYFTEDEFENKVCLEGTIKKGIADEDITSRYNKDEFSALDGKMLKCCDDLAGFIEASLSIEYGTTHPNLEKAKEDYLKKYKDKKIYNLNFNELFENFKNGTLP